MNAGKVKTVTVSLYDVYNVSLSNSNVYDQRTRPKQIQLGLHSRSTYHNLTLGHFTSLSEYYELQNNYLSVKSAYRASRAIVLAH